MGKSHILYLGNSKGIQFSRVHWLLTVLASIIILVHKQSFCMHASIWRSMAGIVHMLAHWCLGGLHLPRNKCKNLIVFDESCTFFVSIAAQVTNTRKWSQQPTSCLWHWHAAALMNGFPFAQNQMQNATSHLFRLKLHILLSQKPQKVKQSTSCKWCTHATTLMLRVCICPEMSKKGQQLIDFTESWIIFGVCCSNSHQKVANTQPAISQHTHWYFRTLHLPRILHSPRNWLT